jgi:hypothetical protein
VDVAVATYRDRFKLDVPIPALAYRSCDASRVLVSTSYWPLSGRSARLIDVTIDSDAAVTTRARDVASVLRPVGVIDVLFLVVGHATVTEASKNFIHAAVESVNRDHATWAERNGWASPLVAFRPTTVIAALDTFPRDADGLAVRNWALDRRLELSDDEAIAVVDLDPLALNGGYAKPADRFIYMGNYRGWRGPLNERDWFGVVRAVLHHEMAHLWGWPPDHDWPASCDADDPFVVSPVLFGWTDVDGDGIPEARDPTPYGSASLWPR